MKAFVQQRKSSTKWKCNPLNGRKCLKWYDWQGVNIQIHNQLIQLSNKKQLNQKMCRRPRHFFREDIQRASRHMKRCSTSLSMREMHIRTTVRHHLALIGMTIIKKPVSNKCWRGCGGKRSLGHYWWECKLVQLLWKTVWNFLKKKKKNN